MSLKFDTYIKRSIQCIDIWQLASWRMKIYCILYNEKQISSSFLDKVQLLTEDRLKISANNTNHYNVGFVGLHLGKTANFIFIDWWADENELHHHVYVSSKENPEKIEYRTPTGLLACVWDLQVINFERKSWVEKVLKSPNPNTEEYMKQRLSI